VILLRCMLILGEWADGGGVFRAFSGSNKIFENVFYTIFRFAAKHRKITNFP
jgi:hypothetical protein